MLKIKENKVKIVTESNIEGILKPFVRWAGGKQNLVKKLSENLPKKPFNRYFEPFVGAGSLFLFNNFENSYISDINPHLINSYNTIKSNADDLFDRLMFHKEKLDENYYYKLRDEFNLKKETFDVNQAAAFIFLVHTSFNGIFRVNKKGEYNVPFGKLKPALPSKNHLFKIKTKLEKTFIENCMYEDAVKQVAKDDFIYFDPPYPPLNDTSYFQHYSIDKFPNSQQEELADIANKLNDIGAFIMISNAGTPMIKKLYSGWKIKKIDTYRYVNCKSERKKVQELIITNY